MGWVKYGSQKMTSLIALFRGLLPITRAVNLKKISLEVGKVRSHRKRLRQSGSRFGATRSFAAAKLRQDSSAVSYP